MTRQRAEGARLKRGTQGSGETSPRAREPGQGPMPVGQFIAKPGRFYDLMLAACRGKFGEPPGPADPGYAMISPIYRIDACQEEAVWHAGGTYHCWRSPWRSGLWSQS